MGSVNLEAVKDAVRQLLAALGEDPERAELAQTPARVADTFAEWCAGVGVNPRQHLQETFAAGAASGQLVALKNIEFQALCEHHLLPFVGTAHIAYLPGEKLAGLGSLTRVVDTLAKRPQLQERLGLEIATEITAGLNASGALVVLEAQHGCMQMRGPKQPAVAVTTSAVGELAAGELKQEALLLLLGSPGSNDCAVDAAEGGSGSDVAVDAAEGGICAVSEVLND